MALWKATPLPNRDGELFAAIVTDESGRQLIGQFTSFHFAERIAYLHNAYKPDDDLWSVLEDKALSRNEFEDSDRSKGLYGKYHVERVDGSSEPGGKHEHCQYFVLDLTHDKHAIPSLEAYALSCQDEYPLLAQDLIALARSNKRVQTDVDPAPPYCEYCHTRHFGYQDHQGA